MRKTLALVCAIVMSLTIVSTVFASDFNITEANKHNTRGNAQPASETLYGTSFETAEEVEAWTTLDQDGDGYNWIWSLQADYDVSTHEGQGAMSSESFRQNVGVLHPDNWLISPWIALPSGATDAYVSFYYVGNDPLWCDEFFGVYVSTDNGATWSEELASFTAGETYQQGTADLSAYAGQAIKIAFRHYNVSNMFALNIDLVEVIGTNTGSVPELPVEPVPHLVYGTSFETQAEVDAWTISDDDGDGHNWTWNLDSDNHVNIDLATYEGNGIMFSESYCDYEWAALTPDNWLISPEITLPSSVNDAYVSFYYMGQDIDWPEEFFGVYISTDGGETWSDELANFTAANAYQQGIVDLNAYAGQTIKIGFRHYNIRDMFILNLDLVEVFALSETPPPVEYDQGDVNMDGNVNTGDAAAILKYVLDLLPLSPEQLELAEMNNDSVVNTGDAAALLGFIMDT